MARYLSKSVSMTIIIFIVEPNSLFSFLLSVVSQGQMGIQEHRMLHLWFRNRSDDHDNK